MSPTEVFAFPLSYAQERLWFLDQLVPHSPLYNIAIASNVRVAVSPALLEKSINEIVRRHEVLRSVFGIANGQPAQIVSSELHIPLRVVNLSERSPDDRRRESVRIANEEALAPFDLGKGPLLRTTLLTQAPKSHILVLVIHHIVSDAWSTELLFSELTSTYTSLATGTPSSLRPLPIR